MLVFILLNLLFFFRTAGQDHSSFTQFYLNPYLLNSSYAGFDGQPSVSLIYRKQWMTIDGAPTIANVTLQAPLNKRVGAGVTVTNESKGFFKNTGLLFSAAYHVTIRQQTFVRFGLSAGGSWNTVDMKKLEAVNDPALSGVLDQSASLAGNAGVSFHHKSLNFGVALPAIFSPAYVSKDAFTVKEVKPFQALIIHASNRFYFNDDKNIFEPYAVYRMNTGLPTQFEFAGIVHLNHTVWAGASYREEFGISGLGGIKLKNALAIGASYSMQQGGYDELNSPSFEVSLNYLFGLRKRGVPVYSFVNAVKVREKKSSGAAQQALAARQKRAEDEKKRKAAAAEALKKAQAEARREQVSEGKNTEEMEGAQQEDKQEHIDAQMTLAEQQVLDQKAVKDKKGVEADAPRIETEYRGELNEAETRRSNGIADSREVIKQSTVVDAGEIEQEGLQQDQEQLQKLQIVSNHSQAMIVDTSRAVLTIRHETVKRGSHPDELAASEYVIAGAFKSSANAKHFGDGLRNLEFNARYGYLTEKNLWFVYILKTNDPERARAEQARVSKMFLLRDAWLLTVQP